MRQSLTRSCLRERKHFLCFHMENVHFFSRKMNYCLGNKENHMFDWIYFLKTWIFFSHSIIYINRSKFCVSIKIQIIYLDWGTPLVCTFLQCTDMWSWRLGEAQRQYVPWCCIQYKYTSSLSYGSSSLFGNVDIFGKL